MNNCMKLFENFEFTHLGLSGFFLPILANSRRRPAYQLLIVIAIRPV